MKKLIRRIYFSALLNLTEPLKAWAEFDLLTKPTYHFFRLTAADEILLRRDHWTRLVQGEKSDWSLMVHSWHIEREKRAKSALASNAYNPPYTT